MWPSNCFWNMVMFSLHTSALMKVWLSTVKVLHGKMLRSVVGWMVGPMWMGSIHVHVPHGMTLCQTSPNTISNCHHDKMCGCGTVRAGANQQETIHNPCRVNMFTFDNFDFKVISGWCCTKVLAPKLSCSMHVEGTNFPAMFVARCYEQNLSKQRHVLNFTYCFFPPRVFPAERL